MSNRLFLDTNILVFLVTKDAGELSSDVRNLISDYSCTLYASSVAILELLQLYRIGKIRFKKGQKIEDIFGIMENELGVSIVSFDAKHAKSLSNLYIVEGHNDPFDHAIISHAIADRYTLVSSDSKFRHYKNQHLNFVYNKR